MVGRDLVPRLAEEYDLTLWTRADETFNGIPTKGVDLTDPAAVNESMKGFDAVVHLAIASYKGILYRGAYSGKPSEEDLAAFESATLRVNNDATYYLMKEAEACGVTTFVNMSSITVVSEGRVTGSLAVDQPAVPRDLYACTKLFGETVGRYLAARGKMRVISLRLGQPYPTDHPASASSPAQPDARAILVHHDDIASGVIKAIESTTPSHGLYNLVSAQAEEKFPREQIVATGIGFEPSCWIEADGTVRKVPAS